jgi:hypothetical protein
MPNLEAKKESEKAMITSNVATEKAGDLRPQARLALRTAIVLTVGQFGPVFGRDFMA